MFLYEKKIVYLAFFWDGVKRSSAGFVRISREKDVCVLDIHIKRAAELPDGESPLLLVLRNRECRWGSVSARAGMVNVKRSIPIRQDMILVGEEKFMESELCGILIRTGEKKWIAGYWQEPEALRAAERNTDAVQRPADEQGLHGADCCRADESGCGKRFASGADESGYGKRFASRAEAAEGSFVNSGGRMLVRPASEDKWEQLQSSYPQVHPFGDERVFLSIEPRDFVILRAPYQKLVNNSFLLHGFYNYRHLLLGPDREIGVGDESCFYLGVPGTYYEREKMVAVMFGFEGFECDGAVEIGKFGYYMRRVEL